MVSILTSSPTSKTSATLLLLQSLMADIEGTTSVDVNLRALRKEWDEALCPICMDHPHNAILLLCSSHDKGCRVYICDTSYRHSNCLDRFKKLRVNSRSVTSSQGNSSFVNNLDSEQPSSNQRRSLQSLTSENHFGVPRMSRNLVSVRVESPLAEYSFEDRVSVGLLEALEEEDNSRVLDGFLEAPVVETALDSYRESNAGFEETDGGSSSESGMNLCCPLCRGAVKGWKIVKEARQYLDLKQRSCSRESCSFSGNYRELRRHARRVHPMTRPGDVDPSRQRAWHHLEHQREYGDIVSAIRSAMPGAIVLGDYVIESGEERFPDRENRSGEGNDPWWTTFFLFHMISSNASIEEPRSRSRAWRRHRRSSGGFSGRRNLGSENLLGLHEEDEGWSLAGDIGEEPSIPTRRRRFTRPRNEEDQP